MEKVVFVKDTNENNPEIVAVFLNKNQRHADGCATCYAHVGQHSVCSLDWAKEKDVATREEYAPLYDEMTRMIGYNLRVMKEVA